MPKYMIQASYTQAGLQGLAKEGAKSRAAAVKKTIAGVGGKVEVLYWSFGDHDLVCIVEAADNAMIAAVNLAVGMSGAATTRTTALLTAEEVDKAIASLATYRAPGS